MAKKKINKNIKNVNIPDRSHAAPEKTKALSEHFQKKPVGNITQMLLAAGIGMITGLFLKDCPNNLLTTWDDDGYITNNPLIRDLSPTGIKNMLSLTSEVMGNYHPLTILTYAIEYSKAGLEPFIYHFDNLLLHVIDTMLVYWLISLLTKRPAAAVIAALLFGLHPMHVESVAWASGRKDVLYALFYLAGCIAYVFYIRANENKKWGLYFLVVALYICALLSKPVAVVFPFSLLLLDYWEQRRLNNGLTVLSKFSGNAWATNLEQRNINLPWLIEKIPHFVLSIVFGGISICNQRQFHALFVKGVSYSFFERIALGCYSLTTYLWKFVIPANLTCFYPYPAKINGSLPPVYYAYILPVAALVFLYLKFFRKYRFLVFGILFFLVNIILLLQFIPVGGAIIAERYSYIAYLGLFFIVGWLVSGLYEPGAYKQTAHGLGLLIICSYMIPLAQISQNRCKVWYDNGTLWRDEIEKNPLTTANGYDNLAFYYYAKFSAATNPQDKKLFYDSTYYLLNTAIKIEPDFPNPYVGLADLEQNSNQPQEAKKNYLKVLTFNEPKFFFSAYQSLAIIYAIDQKYDSAAYYCQAALAIENMAPELHTNYGKILNLMGKQDAAIKEYETAISQKPGFYAPYLERGIVLVGRKQFADALNDLNKAAQLSPQTTDIYLYRSQCYAQMGNTQLSAQDMDKARSLGYGK